MSASAPIWFARDDPRDIRVVTWNTRDLEGNQGFDPAVFPRANRVLSAIAPDIVCFQEIYDATAAQTRSLVEDMLPLSGPWYAEKQNDCAVVSRHPILQSWPLDGNLAVRLDSDAALGADLLLVCAHLPCCAFGPDFAPDWDGSSLADVVSSQTERRFAYTWRNDGSTFAPGRLDFVIYTDSALELRNHFVVYSAEMSAPERVATGIQEGDVPGVSDHLPHVADFRAADPAALSGSPYFPAIRMPWNSVIT